MLIEWGWGECHRHVILLDVILNDTAVTLQEYVYPDEGDGGCQPWFDTGFDRHRLVENQQEYVYPDEGDGGCEPWFDRHRLLTFSRSASRIENRDLSGDL